MYFKYGLDCMANPGNTAKDGMSPKLIQDVFVLCCDIVFMISTNGFNSILKLLHTSVLTVSCSAKTYSAEFTWFISLQRWGLPTDKLEISHGACWCLIRQAYWPWDPELTTLWSISSSNKSYAESLAPV